MVCVDIFELSVKSQIVKTLICLIIIIFGDIFYLYITSNLNRLSNNKIAYITVWLTTSIALGVSILRDSNGNYEYENNKRDNILYGILIALLIHVPVNNWLSSYGKITSIESIYYSCFAIFLTSVASLLSYMMFENNNLK